jgi:hypothetical protein
MNVSLTLVALAIASVGDSPALAQTANPCPTGSPAIVRTSKIKPGGSIAGFQKAVADHARWYASHGYTEDSFSSGRVLTMNPVTRAIAPTPDMMLTLHTKAVDVPAAKHDAAWNAYVAEYNANADIVSTTYVCLSK